MGATTNAFVVDNSGFVVGENVVIAGLGQAIITALPAGQIVYQNTGAAGNAAPGTTAAAGAKVTPTGPTGPSGTTAFTTTAASTVPTGVSSQTVTVNSTTGVLAGDVYYAPSIGSINILSVGAGAVTFQKLQIQGDVLAGALPLGTTFTKYASLMASAGAPRQSIVVVKQLVTLNGSGTFLGAAPGADSNSSVTATYQTTVPIGTSALFGGPSGAFPTATYQVAAPEAAGAAGRQVWVVVHS